jgi:alpha-L-fucosidase
MCWPGTEAIVTSLASGNPVQGKIESIEMLGHAGSLKFTQDAEGLKVELPSGRPCDYAYVLKINGLRLQAPAA